MILLIVGRIDERIAAGQRGGTISVSKAFSVPGSGKRRRNGKADFALALPDIRRALIAKQTLRRIFETHRAQFSFGYSQFTRHVKAYLKEAACVPGAMASAFPATSQSAGAATPAAPSPARAPRQALREASPRFHFDPMAIDGKNLI